MSRFSRREIAEILELEEEFLVELERESILFFDETDDEPGYSVRMLERARVAHSLVGELEVNLAGVAVILRMREDVERLRGQLRTVAEALRARAPGS
jgi:hypothetical protein